MSGNNDKRSVSTDALETLGTIIDNTQKRDAIHLAVEPAVAGGKLYAGQDVGRNADGTYGLYAEKKLGIVDPFLKNPVQKSEMFWLVVYPRQIKSLRHVWEHADFPDSGETERPVDKKEIYLTEKEKAKQRMENFAAEIGESVETILYHADNYVSSRGYYYWTEGGRFEGTYIYGEFWNDYEVLTGKKVSSDTRGSFFSCSC